MALEFHFAIRSDVGLIRKNNQDSGYAGSRLLVVADGMGGPAGGDIASSVVVGQLAHLDDAPGPSDELLTNLADALQQAHDDLVARSDEDRSLKGLGTTCTAILRSENKLAMVHIGDSRAYLLRDGNLVQVTSDHSLVQYLVDTGQITKKEAETHPKRNVVVKVLGDAPGPILADATVREAVEGDRWLLCSDGLSGVVSDQTIAEVMASIPDLDECADELVNYALRAGGPDNITVVLADVVPVLSAKPQVPEIVGAAAAKRGVPTKGTSGAAGRAAALTPPSDSPSSEEETDDDSARRRGRFWKWVMAGTALMVFLGAGLYSAHSWAQDQFFAQASGGKVVVYQGIPQNLGPLQLSRPVEVTDIRLADLPEVDQQRLQDPVMRSSREAMDTYLEELSARLEQRLAQVEPDSTSPQSVPQSEDSQSDPSTGSGGN